MVVSICQTKIFNSSRSRSKYWSAKIFMDKKQLYNSLSLFCKEAENKQNSENHASSNCPPVSEVWLSLFNIANNEPKYLSVFHNLIKEFSLIVNDFKDFSLPEIETSIETLINENNDNEKRYNAAIPLISLLPIFSFQKFMQILSAYIDFINKTITNNKFPQKLLNLLDTIDFNFIEDETIENIYDYLNEQIQTGKSSAALFVLASFIDSILTVNQDIIPDICNIILKYVQHESTLNKMASLYILEKGALQFGNNASSVSKNLISSIFQFLINFNDEDILYRAHKAARHLITNNVLNSKEYALAIINQFKEYPPAKYPFFFKLVQGFLDNYENPNIDIVQIIFDFVSEQVKNSESIYVKGKCLEAISQIAAIDKVFVEDIYEDAFDIGCQMISLPDGKKTCLTEVTNYFLMVSQSFPSSKVQTIYNTLPQIADSLENEETGTKKQRMERAASLSAIIQNKSFPGIVTSISKFLLSAFDTIVGGELFYICSVIIALRTQLSNDNAKAVFLKLENLAVSEIVSPRLNAILHTMKKLLTKFDSNTIDASEFVRKLINGDISYLGTMPLSACQDEKTMIFYFISAFIRKNPLQSTEAFNKLVECLPYIKSKMIPVVLEPVEAAVHANVGSLETIQNLYNTIISITEKITLDDEEEIIACIEILSQIGNSNPDVLDGKKIFELIKSLTADVTEDDAGEIPQLGPLIRFTLELCKLSLNPYVKMDIETNVVLKLIKFLPLPPNVTSMENIIKLLVDNILPNKEKLGFLVVPSLLAITKILILTDNEIKEYEFDAQLLTSMKNILKKMVREDRQLERQIGRNFQSQRPKLNKFSKLLK